MNISKENFREIFEKKLGGFWGRALRVFQNYGENWAADIAIALYSAMEQEKVEEVLGMMERHWQKHLQYEKPEVRGSGRDLFGNPTREMFKRIFDEILKLRPAWMRLSA
ncbi:MAG: hypothetical protein NTX55_02800 [Candidatus Parcubacteria bacterium]|nr:hypothetical protein [Candidatus Parcubacteria bacterium]